MISSRRILRIVPPVSTVAAPRVGAAPLIGAALLAGFMLSLPARPALALIAQGGCVDEVSGASNNCTANDVTFSAVGLGVQGDGCVSPVDTVDVRLRGTVRNTTSKNRYDIGLFVAVDGDPQGDGALSGICAREVLQPVGTTGQTSCATGTPGALDLLRMRDDRFPFDGMADNGPYLDLDGDTCGDLRAQGSFPSCDENGDGLWDDTVIQLEQAVTLPCDDADGDGYAEIPTCVTWGNNSDQVGGGSCDGAAEAAPGTKSKCSCQTADSDIPVPDLGLGVTAPAETLNQGDTGTFEVRYDNAAACSPDPATAERLQCGTAGLIFFVIDYDASKGTVSNLHADSGTFIDQPARGRILWIPASTRAGTPGVIGPGDVGTLTYDFTYTANRMDDTVVASAQGYWTGRGAALGDPESPSAVAQPTLSSLGTVTATPVTLAAARVDGSAGTTAGRTVRWTTATEAANVGFNVYGEGPDGWRRLNDRLVPSQAVDSTAPLDYALPVDAADVARFVIEDVALDGTSTLHGPFSAGHPFGHRPAIEPVDWAAVRSELAETAPSARAADRGAPELRPRAAATTSPRARLLVDEDRIYRVRAEDLLAAGLDFGPVPPDELALTLRGEPVPIRVEAPGGIFGPGAFLEFLGHGLDTLYTRSNVYELARDPRRARRLRVDRTPLGSAEPAAGYRAELRVERDRQYSFASPGDDPWYDTRMVAVGGRRSWRFDVDLDGFRPSAGNLRLEVELWGVTSWPEEGDHHATVSWNGIQVAEAVWDGQAARRIAVPVPAWIRTSERNELTVTLPADRGVPWDVIDLESYTVRYPRRFEAQGGRLRFTAAGEAFRVSGMALGEPVIYRLEPNGPVRIAASRSVADRGFSRVVSFPGTSGAPATYTVDTVPTLGRAKIEPVPARAPILPGQAEYLIISHRAFLGGLGPLVAARRAQGLSVQVVDVAALYDTFSHGVVDPEAIHSFVAYAAREKGTRFVLLVGGDTFDYLDHLGEGSVSFIPSLYAATGPVVRFAPSDPLLADVDGDRVPDLPIGRLPVRTRDELRVVIGKILQYQDKPYGGTALVAADGQDPDSGVSFSRAADEIVRQLPRDWSVRRAYIDSAGTGAARAALFQGLGRGEALTVWVGHSGLTHWSVSGLFGADDVRRLGNRGAPTVVVQWGCWNTYHVDPRFQTLGHRFLLADDRGAAAVLGSATLLQTSSAEALSDRLTPLLVRPGMTIGEAVTRAKQSLAATQPERTDAILGWTLLGDPALTVE